MKTAQQVFVSVVISIVAVVAIKIGVTEWNFRKHENARIAKEIAGKVERAEQMASMRSNQRAEREAKLQTEAFNTKIALLRPPVREYAKANPGTDEFWDSMNSEKIRIGMSQRMVEISWGRPESVNETLTSHIEHQQWVYNSGSYVYFENGIVSAIQTSR